MIYRYKAILPNNKNFLRIYEVKADASLYTFHLFLLNDLSFSPDLQVFFRTYDKSGKQVRACGLFDAGQGSMDQVRLEAIHQKGEDTLHYIFDIFNGRYVTLQFDGIEEEQYRKTYPRTIMEQGGDLDQLREDHLSLDLNFDDTDSMVVDEGDE